jgi:xylulokinase
MSLLGIDVGTSGCKASVFSIDGKCYGISHSEYGFIPADEGVFELDAVNVWNAVKNVIKQAVYLTPSDDEITALSVSSLGEAVVPVTKSREILSTSIISCDKRGANYTDLLKEYKCSQDFYEINPNAVSPNYTLPKLQWIKENQPGIYEKTDYVLLWADFICFMLGSEPFTTNSLANRTLIFDIKANDWSQELLSWSGLERNKFGKIVQGGTIVGNVLKSTAVELGLSTKTLIVSGGHDQCQNALGSGCVKPGTTTCGLGTYECIAPVYSEIPDLNSMYNYNLGVEHHVIPGLYLTLIFNQGGMLIKWFRETFSPEELNNPKIYSKLNNEMPDTISNLLAFPYFESTGSPYYIDDAKGAYIGLTTKTTRGECLKALMEGITFYFIESMNNLKAINIPFDKLVASGGGAKSDKWLQLKSDIINIPVARTEFTECSILGAAMLAGIATNEFTVSEATDIYIKEDKIFYPNEKNYLIYQEKYQMYKDMFNAYYGVYKKLNEK